ncbi:MAG TPA: hypothetical protein VJC03_04940 [bacterium]|nr:hypothetical protein [bacterium]
MAKIVLWIEGILLIVLAFIYSYSPRLTMKVNLFMRDVFFSDRFLLTGSRKKALLCLITGLLLIMWGWR